MYILWHGNLKMNKIVVDISGTPYLYDKDQGRPLNNEEIFAKKLSNTYYVLASRDGNLYNPMRLGIESLKTKDKKRGGKLYNLMNCSKQCYNMYTTFLRSKNLTHFIIAERSFLNGI